MKQPKVKPEDGKYIYFLYDNEEERYLCRSVGSTRKIVPFFRKCDAKAYWSLAFGRIHNKRLESFQILNALDNVHQVLHELGALPITRYWYGTVEGIKFDYQTRYKIHKYKLTRVK